jgi:hypothetical protein
MKVGLNGRSMGGSLGEFNPSMNGCQWGFLLSKFLFLEPIFKIVIHAL